MKTLPAAKSFKPRDAFNIMVLNPIEQTTRSLMRGDEMELRELEPMVNRMRALVNAFDARKNLAKSLEVGGDMG